MIESFITRMQSKMIQDTFFYLFVPPPIFITQKTPCREYLHKYHRKSLIFWREYSSNHEVTLSLASPSEYVPCGDFDVALVSLEISVSFCSCDLYIKCQEFKQHTSAVVAVSDCRKLKPCITSCRKGGDYLIWWVGQENSRTLWKAVLCLWESSRS